MSKEFKAAYVQTSASAQIVVRNAKGHKLFDMEMEGITVTITVPRDAEIKIEANKEER